MALGWWCLLACQKGFMGDFSSCLLGMCSFGKFENCFWPVQYSVFCVCVLCVHRHAHTHTLALMLVC